MTNAELYPTTRQRAQAFLLACCGECTSCSYNYSNEAECFAAWLNAKAE